VRELLVGQVGLSAADVKRFKAVMIAIVSNREVEARWCMGDAATANLVLVSPDSEAAQQFVADPGRNPEQIIVSLVGESDSVSFECEKLPWPIRLANLLELLKRVEQRIPHGDSRTAAEVPRAPAGNKLVQLAKLLRDIESGDDLAWRINGLSEQPVYIAAQQRAFMFDDSLVRLVKFDPFAALDLVPITADQLPPEGQLKPIRVLQWLIGLRSGRIGLLPWIEADGTLRLKQFPEFQLLHHTVEHRRIAAALSRQRSGIRAIGEATQLDASVVLAFVNAASLCGYLKVGDPGAAATDRRKPANGPRRALFQVFRRALGIASNDA
jgi:hypothetical protein